MENTRPALPCMPGDTVWRFCGQKERKRVEPRVVSSVAYRGNGSWQILTTAYDWLGETVFLTKREADAALEGGWAK